MKRIITIALITALVLALAGCGVNVEKEGDDKKNTSMFVVVEKANNWLVVYHKETKVMYAVSYGAYNCGNFTVLVNPDGTPMLWDGE